MLLFHGTRLDRESLRHVFAEGLLPSDRGWMHELTDERAFCFLANAPIAGRGGDPIFFATARRCHTRKPTEGYVVVVDVPPPTLEASLVGVFPNVELEQFLRSQAFRHRPKSFLPQLVRLGRSSEGEQEAFASRGPKLRNRYADLHLEGIDYATWCRYADDVLAARTVAAVERAGRRTGIVWDNPEVLHCELCVQGMALWVYELEPDDRTPLPASVDGARVGADAWVTLARQVASSFEPHPTEAVLRAIETLPKDGTWATLLQRLPIDLDRLPAPWRPDFGLRWTPASWREEDVQLACRAVAPEHVLGAIQLTDGDRFAPWVRPGRGDTMLAKLWRATHAMRDAYRGRPVVFAGP